MHLKRISGTGHRSGGRASDSPVLCHEPVCLIVFYPFDDVCDGYAFDRVYDVVRLA